MQKKKRNQTVVTVRDAIFYGSYIALKRRQEKKKHARLRRQLRLEPSRIYILLEELIPQADRYLSESSLEQTAGKLYQNTAHLKRDILLRLNMKIVIILI